MMRRLLFWGCFPFVLPQALHVRRTAPRFAGASGPRKGRVGTGQNFNLLAIGDSIISGVGATTLSRALVGRTSEELAEALQCQISWTARGRIGASTRTILQKIIPGLPETPADFIIMSVGVNDVTSLTRVSSWKRNLDAILSALANHSPQAIIAVAGIPPLGGFPLLPQPLRALFGMRARTLDLAGRSVIARHPTVFHVSLEFDPRPEEFAPDGYHPNEMSYREFGRVMAARIAQKILAHE